MALGEYRPPNQIANDEDKYFKLTKTQLIYVGIGLMIGFLLFSFFNLFPFAFFRILGLVCCLVCAIAGGFIGGFTIPNSKYLRGGGLRMDQYLKRMAIKRFGKKKKVLYTRNINRDREKLPYINKEELEQKEQAGPKEATLLETLKEMFGGFSE